jgi:mannose-1-phosphate guanylyltransferase
MITVGAVRQTRYCVVIANEDRSESGTASLRPFAPNARQAGAMKMGFLRQSSIRARKLTSPANVVVSAQAADRSVWEGAFWFTKPSNRFVADQGAPTTLATAAALLSIASTAPSSLIAVMPSEFWVVRESVLIEAIDKVCGLLRIIPETVATLGIVDTHMEIDEDYLVVGPNNPQKGAVIQARVNRPDPGSARQLINEGAMIASGILLGYAQAFAARIYKYWPQLAQVLTDSLQLHSGSEVERRLVAHKDILRSVVSSVRLSPPTFPMRAFRVQGSGWCSRKPFGHGQSHQDNGQVTLNKLNTIT